MAASPAGIEISDILAGKKAALAAALNLLENRRPEEEKASGLLIEALTRHARTQRHVVGITGPPGAGKSSLISRIVRLYRAAGLRVGVLAVDPTSRRSGGALLGDRARIEHEAGDCGVFIRSMAAGRHLGGLAGRTRNCLALFEAAFDRILIETVGIGQSETEIEQVADTVLYVVQPGSGDSLQFMKAGILEIPHVLVVNKADLKNLALKACHELQMIAGFDGARQQGWTPVLLLASALEGTGIEAVVAALESHRRALEAGDLAARRRTNRIQWVYLLFMERFGSYGVERLGGEERLLDRLAAADVSNPFRALEALAQEVV